MPFLRRQLVRLTDQLTETQWDVARALALVVLIGGLGVVGALFGVPVWRHWQNRKSLAQAEVFAQKRDYRDLLLALRRATWPPGGRPPRSSPRSVRRTPSWPRSS